MKEIRWGVIGCGGIAYRRTIPDFNIPSTLEFSREMMKTMQSSNLNFDFYLKFVTRSEMMRIIHRLLKGNTFL